MKHEGLIRLVSDQPLALTREKLQQIEAFIEYRMLGGPPVAYDAAAARKSNTVGVGSSGQAVAIIPVMGTISRRMNMMSEMSGGATCSEISGALGQAVGDAGVKSIVMMFDTPGGSVSGIQELADQIRQASTKKRIVGAVDTLAASAGYWLASQCDELVCTPSGEVGSIGVYMMHIDESAALNKEGLKVSYISAGDNKVEGNSAEPLSSSARAFLQQRVNEFYDAFVGAVARGRKAAPSTVKTQFGQGRVFGAKQALAVGMIDRIDTFNNVVGQEMTRKRMANPGAIARTDAIGLQHSAMAAQTRKCPSDMFSHLPPAAKKKAEENWDLLESRGFGPK